MATSEGIGGYNILANQSGDEIIDKRLASRVRKLTCAFPPASGAHQRQNRSGITDHHLVRTSNPITTITTRHEDEGGSPVRTMSPYFSCKYA